MTLKASSNQVAEHVGRQQFCHRALVGQAPTEVDEVVDDIDYLSE